MNIKKNIRKIVALGAAGALVATTFVGALAYDLSSYPAPFVENGMLNGAIVIGQMAKTQDVIGAMDIAASLQAAAITAVSTDGTTTAATTIEGGILLEDSTSQDVNFNQAIGNTLDKNDFPKLLADGELEDDDGTTYDYDQEIIVGAAKVTFEKSINRDFDEPVVHLDNMTNLLTFSVSFDTDVSFTELDNSESFDMFGKSFTVKNVAADEDLVFYASDLTQTVAMGDSLEIEVEGNSYTIEIVGANSDDSSIHLLVNGETRTVEEGDTKTIGGLEIYVQEVYIGNIGGESASAKLFLGGEEFNLGDVGSDNTLQINDKDIDGVSVFVTGTDNSDVESIEFIVDPTEILNEEYDDDYDYLVMGETFVDPVFGYSLDFTEAVPGLMENRDHIEIKGGDELEVTFTNVDGDEFSFAVYEFNDTSLAMNLAELISFDSSIEKDGENTFIVEEDSASSKPVSIVYEYTGTDSNDVSSFKNLATNDVLDVKDGGTIGKSTSIVNVVSNTDDAVTVTGVQSFIYTISGMNVWFSDPIGSSSTLMGFYEDANQVYASEVVGKGYISMVSVGTSSEQDDELIISEPTYSFTGASDDNGNVWYGINDYGTYAIHDDDENQYLDLYVPFGEVDFNVYLSGPNAIKVVSTAVDTGAYIINPAGLGVGILDSDAPSLGSKPMIVVGGPIVNTVAAELMGNPTSDEIMETFEAGKAIIKFYSAHDAILVAGYESLETQAACNVLVNYEMHNLAGEEMEVLATSLDDIQVNAVD